MAARHHAVVGCAVALLCAQAGPVTASPERRDPLLPQTIRQVIGLPDGSGLVLGAAAQLVQIRAPDAIERIDHPLVGHLFHAATRGPELWVLGQHGLLHRRGTGPWAVVALETGTLDPDRRSVVVATGDGDALVFATLLGSHRGAGTAVIRVPAHGAPREAAWFERFTVPAAVGDGDGAVWALLAALEPHGGSSPAIGYLRLQDDRWTLFHAGEPRTLPGIEHRATARVAFDSLVADGRGGAYATTGDRAVFHIDAEGAARELPLRPAEGPDAGDAPPRVDLDERGRLVIAAVSATGGGPVHVDRIDPAWPDAPGRHTRVALPAWYVDTDRGARRPLAPLSLSAAAGVVWIAAGPLIVSDIGGTWTTFVEPAVPEWMAADERDQRQRARGPLLTFGPGVLTLTAGIAAAGFGISRIHDERAFTASLQVVAGSTAGFLPWIAATHAPTGSATTPGEAIRQMMYVGAASATPTFTALGTWGVGELTGGSQHRGRALLGAWGGATVGTVVGLALTRLGRDTSRPVRHAIEAFGLALLGTGATLGYQLAGGGPD